MWGDGVESEQTMRVIQMRTQKVARCVQAATSSTAHERCLWNWNKRKPSERREAAPRARATWHVADPLLSTLQSRASVPGTWTDCRKQNLTRGILNVCAASVTDLVHKNKTDSCSVTNPIARAEVKRQCTCVVVLHVRSYTAAERRAEAERPWRRRRRTPKQETHTYRCPGRPRRAQSPPW